MKRVIYLAFVGAFLSAWITAAGLLWLVMGPWLLCRFLACRIGYHGRTFSTVNAANQNTEMRCTLCSRFLPNSRRIPSAR
jgi:hypothetical protein